MPHIVTAFENQLQDLKSSINEMGRIACAQFAAALDCLEAADAAAAQRVVAGDRQLDVLEQHVDDDVIRLLALRQPMGGDLRRTIAALRIAADLERIGDYAANIAKRVIALARMESLEMSRDLVPMGRLALEIVGDVARAYADRDADRALAAWRRDREVDALHTRIFAAILQAMADQPDRCAAGAHYLFIAKNIERIGDHATNIAENVHFLITGTRLPTDRPKEDESSFTVVTS
jgi:phosphate transport system protein